MNVKFSSIQPFPRAEQAGSRACVDTKATFHPPSLEGIVNGTHSLPWRLWKVGILKARTDRERLRFLSPPQRRLRVLFWSLFPTQVR